MPILAEDDAYVAPRGPGGVNPDLNGIWQALNEANYDIERHMARPSMSLRDGPYGPLPDLATLKLGAVASVPPGLGVVDDGGRIPYKPEALAVRDENRRLWVERDPEIKCFLPGVPRATYMPQPFQILQGDKEIEIVYQWGGAVRNIYSDDRPDQVDSWMGHSVASWEGDTLVVKVTGLIEKTWFDRAGNHHSNQMTVVERYTPTSPNHLHYEATITDPVTFTRPWKISMPLYRRMEPNAMILDFKCVEFVEELMYGKYRRNPLPPWSTEGETKGEQEER